MTWHAASHLLLALALILLSAMMLVFAAMAPHHGWFFFRRTLKNWFGPQSFIVRHFVTEEHIALRLIVGGTIAAGWLILFLHILRGVMSDPKVAAADLRLHNTLRMFQSPTLHLFYSSVSDLASAQFLVPVVGGFATLLWIDGRRREAVTSATSLVLAAVAALALKHFVQRPRPTEAQGFVAGASFPSGHTLAATVVYGFFAYLLLRDAPWRWSRWFVLPLTVLICLVPISRVYLGVHWPYDTIGSLALGAALLAILIVFFKFPVSEPARSPDAHRAWPRPAFVVFGIAVALYACFLFQRDVQIEVRPAPVKPSIAVTLRELSQAYPPRMPRASEDLIGGPMEPASFLLVGNIAAVRSRFSKAGWFEAETPSVRGLARELWCVIRNRPDPTGPATPSYFAAQPQDLTFELAGTESGSIRQRHHIRIWRAPATLDTREPLWVATCSYDQGVKFVKKPYLVTHRIDPRVDLEREFIDASLRGAGARDVGFIAVTPPQHGKNAGGDSFTTDGKAHVVLVD
jgi:membrane-associated phospholipid phosphatase